MGATRALCLLGCAHLRLVHALSPSTHQRSPRDLSGDGGCILKVTKPSLPNALAPRSGHLATVHFRAHLDDGTLLRDTWRDGEPIELLVGAQPSEMTPGWDLALPNLAVGQRVELLCEPAYAYGDAGAPPLIPPQTSMRFEIELLRTRSLETSHNPEEVDYVERYRQLVENKEHSMKRKRVQNPSGAVKAVTTASASSLTNVLTVPRFAAADTPAPPRSSARVDGPKPRNPRDLWTPDRTRIRGSHASGYTWDETDTYLEVTFELPLGTTKERVGCEIRPRHISVELEGVPLARGELSGRVDVDGCAWTFEADETSTRLTIHLTKAEVSEKLWGYPLYNPRLQDATKSPPGFDDLSDDEPGLSEFGSPGVSFGDI